MASHHRKSLSEVIYNFAPQWFTVNMGTGIVASLVSRFHWGLGSMAVEVISLAFFLFNLGLFVVIGALTITRYIMFPKLWWRTIAHPAQSLGWGGFAMGTATLINSALTANQTWNFSNTGFLYTLWGFWWINLTASYVIAFGMFYVMMTTHEHTPASLGSVWMLPMVTLIVTSSCGGLLADAIRHHDLRIAMVTTAIAITADIIGISLAVMILTVYLMRLVIHGPPDVAFILSSFIAIGPFGQGGFSLLTNGQNLYNIFPLYMGTELAATTGQMLFSACFCAAWVCWAAGAAWLIITLCSVYATLKKGPIPFSFPFWGVIFPCGVYALLTVQMGEVIDSPFFQYLGSIYSILVLIMWIITFIKTIPRIWDTSIFIGLPPDRSEKMLALSISDASSRTVEPSPA